MSQKRKISPPTCDLCEGFLYGPCSSGAQMVCEACAILGGSTATPHPRLAQWIEASFEEEWTRKKATVMQDVCAGLEKEQIFLRISDLPENHQDQIVKQIVMYRDQPGDIKVADVQGPVPLTSLYLTIEAETTEVPTINRAMGFISVCGEERWKTLVLVHAIAPIVEQPRPQSASRSLPPN